MKFLVLSLFFGIAFTSAHGQKEKCKPCSVDFLNDSTYYPKANKLDYEPKSVFAKVGFPQEKGVSRIWVKGNSFFNRAYIATDSLGTQTDTINLVGPYYTEIFTLKAKNDYHNVEFLNFENKRKSLTVKNFTQDDLNNSSGAYSLLFYGCFQPFTVSEEKEPVLLETKSKANYRMREAFTNIGLGNILNYEQWNRKEEDPRYFQKAGIFTQTTLSKPLAIIGTGDQIYVDAGYKYKDKEESKTYRNHPLSAWAYNCCDPQPLLAPEAFQEHLNKTYNAFNSFNTLDTLFRIIPSINIWDDHEIRDGWGSHGDEYDNGVINENLRPYYESSKKAYIEHQWIVGSKDTVADDLSQIFRANEFYGFAFDLRTHRNIKRMEWSVLGHEQFLKFKKWARTVPDNEMAVLISSIPFFYHNTKFAEKNAVGYSDGELLDDLQDSWAANSKERNAILQEIVMMRKRGIKPIIIAGDVHLGAMTEVWYEPANNNNTRTDASKILCYELIASGLSHESLAEKQNSITGFARHRSEGQRWNDPTIHLTEDQIIIYPSTRLSKPDLNFGAVEVLNNQQKLHLFTTERDGENTEVIQHTINIDWNATYADYQRLKTKNILQWFLNIFSKGEYYSPPVVNSFRIIKN